MTEQSLSMGLVQLAAQLVGRRVKPRVPEGRKVVVPVSDGDEDIDPEAPTADPEPRGLFIVYRAEDGAISERVITVRQLIGNPPEMMLAWCHMRNRPRHFRLDRIVEAVDPESGEVIAVEGLAELLQTEHLPIDRRVRQVVNVLVFIARCDGSIVRPEWMAIEDSIAYFMTRFGGDDEIHRLACIMARQIAPSGDDLIIALRSFAAAPERRELGRWLTQALKAVVDADGVHTREEFEWIERITDIVQTMKR